MNNEQELVEISKDTDEDFTDLESLLTAVNSKSFTPSENYVADHEEFEKLDSFFELVRVDGYSETKLVEENVEDSAQEEGLEEEAPAIHDDLGESLSTAEDELAETIDDDLHANVDQSLDETGNDFFDKDNPSTAINEVNSASEENHNNSSVDKDMQPESEELEVQNESEEYDRGYQTAILEFEKTMELERKSIEDLGENLFRIEQGLKSHVGDSLKKMIIELSSEFVGYKIDELPEKFVNHIENCANQVFSEVRELQLELSHADFEILKSIVKVQDFDVSVVETSDLRRGEFRISSNNSGFKQNFSDK